MPAFAVHHQHAVKRAAGIFPQELQRAFIDLPLYCAPEIIILADLARELIRFLRILTDEQTHRPVRRTDPSCCVDARHDCKCDIASGRRPVCRARVFQQAMQAQTIRLGNQLQPFLDQNPVLALQRNNVADSSDCHQIGIIIQQRLHIAVRTFQGRDQLERHAHAGKIFIRQIAVPAERIDNSHRLWKLLLRAVVIGDYHIYPKRFRVFYLAHRSDPVVHRDNQPDAAFVQRINRTGIHAISLALAFRDIEHHVGPARFQIRIQNRCGRHAVGIVIAINSDPIHLVHRAANPIHRLFHIRQQQRIEEIRILLKQGFYLFTCTDPPDFQHHRQKKRQFIASRKLRSALLI